MGEFTHKELRINGDRLWDRLMSMAEIGATDKGGSNRQALSDLDMQGRDLFLKWCEAAGCSYIHDEIGNLFVRRPGQKKGASPVMTGSHLDTQPTGGRFDGVYGVLSGLEVVETLNDNNIQTQHPIDIVVWTNEEGSRFSPAMLGSGVFGGVFDLEKALEITDKSGISVRQALEESKLGTGPYRKDEAIKAAFEVHIEQGPILEAERKQIGVVSGIQGIRWYDLKVIGSPVHAGPTPMESRKDPFRGLAAIVNDIYKLAEEKGPWGRATFGDVKADPGSRNTVPESLTLAVDLRHPDQDTINEIDKRFRSIVETHCENFQLDFEIHDEWNLPAVKFDEDCVSVVSKAVEHLGYEHKHMVSGAGHDAGYIAELTPTSMIFIPCEDGISHNEAENVEPIDCEAGCNVLLHSILSLAVPVEN